MRGAIRSAMQAMGESASADSSGPGDDGRSVGPLSPIDLSAARNVDGQILVKAEAAEGGGEGSPLQGFGHRRRSVAEIGGTVPSFGVAPCSAIARRLETSPASNCA